MIPIGRHTLGLPLPFTIYAIAVSYPKLSDVALRKSESSAVNAIMTGYPCFFVHRSVQKLITIC
ncbi:hypothetical protein F5J12DRAFT_814630 [Pisolithus orientalis]|uniref:uncharacterized protein n=1 Tax=Pisolithus orientalis TaxID=936130 RepID=UPI002224C845|nr:uncharacterized protein F5J12DRAFT_814630 [Pisolithus orientalis]KAI6019991.1 hypothetical protein F5J12DRAFT_814630 [Pisolithus orientalis]